MSSEYEWEVLIKIAVFSDSKELAIKIAREAIAAGEGIVIIPGPWIRCNNCGDIIRSEHRHDFKYCKCESLSVDGGSDYLKIGTKNNSQYTIIYDKEEIL